MEAEYRNNQKHQLGEQQINQVDEYTSLEIDIGI